MFGGNGIVHFFPDQKIGEKYHNELRDIQGGTPNQRFHITENQHEELSRLLFQPPTINVTPLNLGKFEVGSNIDVSGNYELTYTNTKNILDQKVLIGKSRFDLPYFNHEFRGSLSRKSRGSVYPFTASVFRIDNNVEISVSPILFFEYRVFWLITDIDLMTFSNENLSTWLRENSESELKSNNDIGIKEFRNHSMNMSNIYVAVPKSYTIPNLAPSAFPNSPSLTESRYFNYSFGEAITDYVLVKMVDAIGPNGIYESIIN